LLLFAGAIQLAGEGKARGDRRRTRDRARRVCQGELKRAEVNYAELAPRAKSMD
jgi:hypothetical protein